MHYTGSNNRKSLIDLVIPVNFNGELIVFVHGFMGFKDWGAWNLMQNYFTEKGFGFCKYNATHNGGTIEKGIDFPDEQAFGENTYSKELNDLISVLDWLETKIKIPFKVNLIGHSRGGGIALLASNEDKRIQKTVTLAAICDIASRFPTGEALEEWKKSGVRYVANSRTKQNLPNYYTLYEDFKANEERLNIHKGCESVTIPVLVIHGDQDTSVPISEGKQIANWLKTELITIPATDHVYGATHPWNKEVLPEKLEEVCEKIYGFLKASVSTESTK
jgi:pimeloyl-ACP methyl ester carboxylesterase